MLDLIYPPVCLLCKKRVFSASEKKVHLCRSCESHIHLNRPPFCRKCSRPLASAGLQCRTCRKKELHFDYAWGACLYNDYMRRLIHLLKYGNRTLLRHFFLEKIFFFLDSYRVNLRPADLIIPIPLHPARFRERGFNQAQILARMIAEKIDKPLSSRYLIRERHTRHQAVLLKKERWTNIEGAFTIKHSPALKDKHILLVDDLFTTGATVSEAAKMLKSAGAAKVGVLALAIAPGE